MSLNTNTNVALINTQIRSGTITLPNTVTLPGRMITFKDITGSFQLSSLTLAAQAGNTIEGSFSTILTNRLGWTTLVANTNSRWDVIGGTQINNIVTSTVNATYVSTGTLSFANISSISTLYFKDQLYAASNTLSVFSTFLFYSTGTVSTIVAGGPRQSYGGLFLTVKP